MINNNTKITQELKRAFGMSEQTGYPRKVSEAILPVVNVNPKYCNIVKGASGGVFTLYTTPTDKDFYLTSCSLTIGKLVTDTGTDALAIVSPEGGTPGSYIISIAGTTLTANQAVTSVSYNPPIKLARGTAIATGGANISRIGLSITGYTEDNTGE